MLILQLALTILQLICAVAIILIVLLQSGKKAGLSGAIGGVADTFMSKNKGKSLDARLAKMTKWIALVFVVLTIALSVI
ncbi:MAG: preprotein translocase subunit SecG [Clostridiales bacterium]|jgi:preprotein translocase subunit SecG|nr:preprotein translocase subunit SecG [Clostridiales bacterium]